MSFRVGYHNVRNFGKIMFCAKKTIGTLHDESYLLYIHVHDDYRTDLFRFMKCVFVQCMKLGSVMKEWFFQAQLFGDALLGVSVTFFRQA